MIPTQAERLAFTSRGLVRYELKTPYRDGTTDVMFEPNALMTRLAAPVPKPRANLTRFHRVFSPRSRYRDKVTSANCSKGGITQGVKSQKSAARPVNERKETTWA